MILDSDDHGVLPSNECSGGFAKIIEDLEWKLQRELQNSDWWWKKCWELEGQLQTQALRVTSPLTKHTEWGDTPKQQGHHWSWYTVFCPCCKRPLDVTMMRKDTESQAATGFPVVEQCDVLSDAKEGEQGHTVVTSSEGDGLPDTFESLGTASAGSTLLAAGPIEMVNSVHPLVSVQPQGAVDGRCLQLASSAASELSVCGANAQANAQTKDPRLQVERHESRNDDATTASPRYAYCAVIWGANAGYTLGALVLGARLKELSVGKVQHDRILLHTDDVPSNFVTALKNMWTVVRQVDYIDAVETMYIQKGGGFDGVFTKLQAWSLTDYDRVLLLDVDIIPLQLPEPIFDTDCPAAFVRGNGEEMHGSAVDGRRFFVGDVAQEHRRQYGWCQSGGINAGVILFQPCQSTLDEMISECSAELHPEHLPSPGPEQDYLTRFFASAPWHALHVKWNYQIHHVPFSMEHVLQWQHRVLGAKEKLYDSDRVWIPPRLSLSLEEIGIVHFSGDVKFWHICLQSSNSQKCKQRAVEHVLLDKWLDTDTFTEYYLRDCCEGYDRWVERSRPQEEYEERGCVLKSGGRVELQAGDASEDVTPIVDLMVDKLRGTTRLAANTWRGVLERLLVEMPMLLEDLREPQVPEGCYIPGANVEVSWSPERAHPDLQTWLPACVMAVHQDGRHVVRYERGGGWGDSERGVELQRIRHRSLEVA